MEENNFYIKGFKDDIVSRISQVHTITMFCPISDYGVQSLKNTFEIMAPKYKTGENVWSNVPTLDALNAFLFTTSFCDNLNLDINKDVLGVIASSLRMFTKLKKITFEFTDDKEIENTYNLLLKKVTDGPKKVIYRVDVVEMNLSDMFCQTVIDLINRVFMTNEVMPNSYLERKFRLDFKYDEYVNFMNMFIGNNIENLNKLDENICDYFTAFPQLIIDQKPEIRVITNYKDDVSV